VALNGEKYKGKEKKLEQAGQVKNCGNTNGNKGKGDGQIIEIGVTQTIGTIPLDGNMGNKARSYWWHQRLRTKL